MNRRNYLLILSLYFGVTVNLSGQDKVTGRVTDAISSLPMSLVHVTTGHNKGVTTDENGNFKINVTTSGNQELIFSHIGYETQVISTEDLEDQNEVEIKLKPISKQLNEISIAGENYGSEVAWGSIDGYGHRFCFNRTKGDELGILIKKKKSDNTKYLSNIKLNIASNPFDSMRFKLKIFPRKGKYKSDNLIREDIILLIGGKEGIIEFNLVPFEIELNSSVIISLEWMEDAISDEKLCLHTSGRSKNSFYLRRSGQKVWEPFYYQIGLEAEVDYISN